MTKIVSLCSCGMAAQAVFTGAPVLQQVYCGKWQVVHVHSYVEVKLGATEQSQMLHVCPTTPFHVHNMPVLSLVCTSHHARSACGKSHCAIVCFTAMYDMQEYGPGVVCALAWGTGECVACWRWGRVPGAV